MTPSTDASVVDHLVVGSADLDTGVQWVQERLGVVAVPGGSHPGAGTRNALVGLGPQYLEVLALDPDQAVPTSGLGGLVARLDEPTLVTLAVARRGLVHPIAMARTRPDGVRLEWELEFTGTPLFFIDWKGAPRPSGLPEAGRITDLTVTTPQPELLTGVAGVTVRRGPWLVEAAVDGTWLV